MFDKCLSDADSDDTVDVWCSLSICRLSFLLSNFFKTGKEVVSGALEFFPERVHRTTPLLK